MKKLIYGAAIVGTLLAGSCKESNSVDEKKDSFEQVDPLSKDMEAVSVDSMKVIGNLEYPKVYREFVEKYEEQLNEFDDRKYNIYEGFRAIDNDVNKAYQEYFVISDKNKNSGENIRKTLGEIHLKSVQNYHKIRRSDELGEIFSGLSIIRLGRNHRVGNGAGLHKSVYNDFDGENPLESIAKELDCYEKELENLKIELDEFYANYTK